MAFTQADIDKARAEGVQAAIKVAEDELAKAQAEVKHAEDPNGNFAAANKDRAILKRNVIRDLIRDMRKV